MADPNYIEPVELTIEQVKERSLELSSRPFLSAVDQVELNIIVNVLTGERDAFWITNIWRTVLTFHNHDSRGVAYIDEKEWGHEPYAAYREEARTVYRRLQALAAGNEVEEDQFVLYPQDDEEGDSSERYLRSLLARTVEYLDHIYSSPGYFAGKDLLEQVGYEVFQSIRQHFAQEWFDDPYAVGYAMMKYPIEGSSAFGGYLAQIALIKALAEIVADATQSIGEKDCDHRLQLFWPLLKSLAYFAAREMNSPASEFDDELLDTVERALIDGQRVYSNIEHRLHITTHCWSEVGVEVQSTPSSEVVHRLRTRITLSRKEREQMALMR